MDNSLSKGRNFLVDVPLSRLHRRDILSHLLLFACHLQQGLSNDGEIIHCGLELRLYVRSVGWSRRRSRLNDRRCLIS
jgi:hypothetical protein